MGMKQIQNDLIEAMSAASPKTSPYDTEAEVVRVEGGTAWVHIPGGVDETPVAMTINASAGDTVRVRVGNGSAWLVGNDTAPPTDDTLAKEAIDQFTARWAKIGTAIIETLKATGINADWINIGALVIYDDDNNEIFRADKTGKVFQWDMARSKLSNNGYLDLYSTSDEESAGVTITRKDSSGNVDLDQIMQIGADGIYATGLWSTNRSYSWHFSVTDPPRLRIEARDANNERHIFFVNFNSTLDEGGTFDPGIWWDGYSLTTPMERTFSQPTSLSNMTLGTTWTARVQKAGCTVTLAFNFNGYFTTSETTAITLFTLPAIYRPKYSMLKICTTQSGVRYILTINSSGAVQLQNMSGAAGSSSVFFREIVTWVREMRVN